MTMTIGPHTITIQIKTCQGCPALQTKSVGLATHARCAEANEVIGGWWTVTSPVPAWCPANERMK